MSAADLIIGLIGLVAIGVLSKQQTWTRRVALAVDIFTASAIWTTRSGITISSYCGLALRAEALASSLGHKLTFGNQVLCVLGRVLNRIQTNHCEQAITDDYQRARDAAEFLGST